MDPSVAEKVMAGDQCPCIESNGIPTVAHLGEERIVYAGQNGTLSLLPARATAITI